MFLMQGFMFSSLSEGSMLTQEVESAADEEEEVSVCRAACLLTSCLKLSILSSLELTQESALLQLQQVTASGI